MSGLLTNPISHHKTLQDVLNQCLEVKDDAQQLLEKLTALAK